jgi:hypothetical protein
VLAPSPNGIGRRALTYHPRGMPFGTPQFHVRPQKTPSPHRHSPEHSMQFFHARTAALAFLFSVGCAALSAVLLWRTYCEGFGCTGLGIAWFAWSVAIYAPTLVLGLLVRGRPSLSSNVRRAATAALSLHLVSGFALGCYWVWHLPPRQ